MSNWFKENLLSFMILVGFGFLILFASFSMEMYKYGQFKVCKNSGAVLANDGQCYFKTISKCMPQIKEKFGYEQMYKPYNTNYTDLLKDIEGVVNASKS